MDHLDVIAVGAHPDDVEIGCGGTVAKLAAQGYRVGIVDLTDGEPTPLSPSPQQRLAEAQEASEVLGAARRVTLALPNRRLFDCFDTRIALAAVFRQFRPRLVLGLGGPTPMASPDHYQAGLITDGAVFYSRLTKWDEHFGHHPPHRVSRHVEYFLPIRSLAPPTIYPLVVDITDTLDKKLAAIACYRTQFPPERQGFFDRVRALALQQGMAAGFAAGEVLSMPSPWGTRDLMGLLFGPAPEHGYETG